MQRSPKVAIVAAMEREVRPLVENWRETEREHQGRGFTFFEDEHAVLVCGGIGAEAARRAGEAIVVAYDPFMLMSVGFAGALDQGLRAGSVFAPHTIIDAGDGSRIEGGGDDGVLLSFASIVGPEQKARLAKAYGAQAVDMEAAAVARAAQAHGIEFRAIKAISDEADFAMPPLLAFLGDDGRLKTAKLVVYAVLRPWLWLRFARLARNSYRAANALCAALARFNCPAALGPRRQLQPASGPER